MKFYRIVAFALVVYTVLVLACLACSPAQRSAEEKAIQVTEKAIGPACVLIRAIAPDDTIREICATAEELAPFVESLIEARAGNAPVSSTVQPLVVAAAMPSPKKKTPRRHCAAWVNVNEISGSSTDAGRQDAGADGGGPADAAIRD